jgi:hypothetical protein
MKATDRLEGNPEAQASRERYRDIIRAMGDESGRFVVRFEIRLLEDGSCTLIATSSRGAECDREVCELAVGIIQALTGVKIDPPKPDPYDYPGAVAPSP